jgi:hypothetical protein
VPSTGGTLLLRITTYTATSSDVLVERKGLLLYFPMFKRRFSVFLRWFAFHSQEK